jgi:predicted NAD/FAD-binding protein
MLQLLGVSGRWSDMSFSVRCSKSGLEYQGSSLDGLFAQRRNLICPSFHRMLLDILRFNRSARELLREEDDSLEMGEYLARGRYSRQFIDHYLVPMGAAIWSARPDRFLHFPARFLIRFFDNHGLLNVRDHPRWQTVVGGAARYVESLTKPYAGKIRLNCPVVSLVRHEGRRFFGVSMILRRRELSRGTLIRALMRHPWMTGRVSRAIYWQALRLWLKKNPFYSHPKYRSSARARQT